MIAKLQVQPEFLMFNHSAFQLAATEMGMGVENPGSRDKNSDFLVYMCTNSGLQWFTFCSYSSFLILWTLQPQQFLKQEESASTAWATAQRIQRCPATIPPQGRQYLTQISHALGKCFTSLAPLPSHGSSCSSDISLRLKIHSVRGLILSAWIWLDKARLTTLTGLLPSPLQGLYFSSLWRLWSWRLGRSHCTTSTKQSLSCVLAIPHASRKSGAKEGDFQGFSRLPTSSIQHWETGERAGENLGHCWGS